MGGGFRWTERFDPHSFEIVDDAGAKRRLGADDDEVDGLVLAEGDHPRMVRRIQRHTFGLLRDSGIARRAIETIHKGAGSHFPCQGMLASARSEQ